MADIDSYTKQHQPIKKQIQAYPSKYYTNFFYKALTVLVFLVIIPFFPSQAPEFINQTLLNRTWELLHLLFVGIAITYGLFSQRNDETEKGYNNSNQSNKFDDVQSLVSRFLQVSSVFDYEAENLSGSDHETKFQAWSSQYYRNEPPIIVAKEQAVVDEHTCSTSPGNPLLLPVRRLKSRVLNKTSRISKNEDLRGLEHENKVVLPSPIPWRSKSGRMEMKEDIETRSFKSQSARFSRSNSMASSPKKSSYTRSLSMETQAKSTEDVVKKKGILRSPQPPLPPLKRVNYGKAIRKPIFMEFPKEEKRGLVEKMGVETTDDDSDCSEGEEINETLHGNASSGINDGGSDVDKKADEFIAKVREQIRLQRIDSIKRSSAGQFKRKSTW